MDLFCQIMWKNTYVSSKNLHGYFQYQRCYQIQSSPLVWSSPMHGWRKMARKILNFKVNGSYPQGCPKKQWFDNIRSDLDKLWLLTSLALDRVKWRNAIKRSRHVAESNPCCPEKKDVKLDSILVLKNDLNIKVSVLDVLWLEYFRRYRSTNPEPPKFESNIILI